MSDCKAWREMYCPCSEDMQIHHEGKCLECGTVLEPMISIMERDLLEFINDFPDIYYIPDLKNALIPEDKAR